MNVDVFRESRIVITNLEVYNTSRKEAHASTPSQLGDAPDRTAPRSERSQRHAPWFRRRRRVPVSKAELPLFSSRRPWPRPHHAPHLQMAWKDHHRGVADSGGRAQSDTGNRRVPQFSTARP